MLTLLDILALNEADKLVEAELLALTEELMLAEFEADKLALVDVEAELLLLFPLEATNVL